MAERAQVASSGSRLREIGGAILAPLVPLVLFLIGWQLWVSTLGSFMIPGPVETFTAFFDQLTGEELWEAFRISNMALLIGYSSALLFGLPLGLLMGRRRRIEDSVNVWINIALITPMAMLFPVIIMALGFGLAARAVIVALFVFPVIVVNSRAGVREVDNRLIDMATSYGASERQLWTHVLLPGAAPAIWTGIRLGIGRGVSGMILVEMLLVGVGLGALLLQYRGTFQPENVFALVAFVVAEALVLVQLAKALERKATPWVERGAAT